MNSVRHVYIRYADKFAGMNSYSSMHSWLLGLYYKLHFFTRVAHASLVRYPKRKTSATRSCPEV